MFAHTVHTVRACTGCRRSIAASEPGPAAGPQTTALLYRCLHSCFVPCGRLHPCYSLPTCLATRDIITMSAHRAAKEAHGHRHRQAAQRHRQQPLPLVVVPAPGRVPYCRQRGSNAPTAPSCPHRRPAGAEAKAGAPGCRAARRAARALALPNTLAVHWARALALTLAHHHHPAFPSPPLPSAPLPSPPLPSPPPQTASLLRSAPASSVPTAPGPSP